MAKAKLRLFGYNIFIASSISFYILMIIAVYFSTYRELFSFKSLNNVFNTQTIAVLIFFLFWFILALLYRIKILRIIKKILSIIVTLNELEESYSKKDPFIIMGVGYFLLLVSFLIIFYISHYLSSLSPLDSLVLGFALLIGFISVFIGTVILIVSFSAKAYLEGQVSFTLEKANNILSRIQSNQLDTEDRKELRRYIYLSYRNIKSNFRTLDLEYTFFNLLPDYLEVVAGKKEVESLKNNLELMSKSIKEKDESGLITELLKLNKNIISYMREIGFNLTDEKFSRQSSWMLRNKDTIINPIITVLSLVSTILGILYSLKILIQN